MSWPALGWASKQKPGRVADKMVLIALADRHNEEHDLSWPSLAWLSDFCCLDRKTVICALDRLEKAGFIADSGKRVGRTNQVKAYTLSLNSPEKGIPKTEPLEAKDAVFSDKQSQKRNTEPVLEPITPISSNEDTPPAEKSVRVKPEHLLEAWNDMAGRVGLSKAKSFDQMRRRKTLTLIKTRSTDDITEAIAAVERSPFCRGENDRGWKADFDFLLQPKSFNRLIEGFYG